MGVCEGKHSGSDNESDRKQMKCPFDFSSNRRKGQQTKDSSCTTIYDLPLEMLDIILRKSFLHWLLKLSKKQKAGHMIRSLLSVDVCFNRRITKQRFRRTVWSCLVDFYDKSKKVSAIVLNNHEYLLANIQPDEKFIDLLFSLNCLTKKERDLILQQNPNRDKNTELLYIARSLDATNFPNFVKCLRETNQRTVTRIILNRGVVIKVKVKACEATCTKSIDLELLHQRMNELSNGNESRSDEIEALISQLKEEGMEILNSQVERQTLVVWIWCRSKEALENLQRLYQSNQLRDKFLSLKNSQLFTSEVFQSNVINIDSHQFKKRIVVYPASMNFCVATKIAERDDPWRATKLRNEIYVLCRPVAEAADTSSHTSFANIIRVYGDEHPWLLKENVCIDKVIQSPTEIQSIEIDVPRAIQSIKKDKCVYVLYPKCIWKMTKESSGEHKIIRWLTLDFKPISLSVSRDGQLMLVDDKLRIYGSDAVLTRSIQMRSDLVFPRHAVETSVGNYIIIHDCWSKAKGDGEILLHGSFESLISELSRDGQTIIRRFTPLNGTQSIQHPTYLALDSDDRLFVADFAAGKVILLDSDLKWNRVLFSERTRRRKSMGPLYYDEEIRQLIVVGNSKVTVLHSE